MPYLAMIDRLRAFLRGRAAALIVCGYSFNDEHLNEVITQGLEGNPTAAAFGLLHGELGRYGRARALALRRSNLSLLAEDAAIVGTHEAEWAPSDAPAQTEPMQGNTEPEKTFTRTRFPLGDFAVFGAMLGEMIGERSLEPRGT
jgi:hypothetical protein